MDLFSTRAEAVSLAAVSWFTALGCVHQDAPRASREEPRRAASTEEISTNSEPAPPPSVKARAREEVGQDGTPVPPAGLACLAQIYEGEALFESGTWWLKVKSGALLRYDDGEAKTEEERLERPDLEDTLEPEYPSSTPVSEETRPSDPGRARHLELFMSYYGESEEAVRKRLTIVDVLGSKVAFHEKGAERLGRVAAALRELVREKPELARYFKEIGGGFSWRSIEGTERPSAHSFGIALDLNPRLGAYYLWNSSWNGNYPAEIVAAFEREGFIWGGRWKHYDAMHFELRPELVGGGCARRDAEPRAPVGAPVSSMRGPHCERLTGQPCAGKTR